MLRLRLLFVVFLTAYGLATSVAYSAPPPENDSFSLKRILGRAKDNSFIAPNEINPENALPHIRAAPAGTYVSVGTERGFISASMNAQVTQLLLVDANPSVQLFNHINVALLRGAKAGSRKEYLRLRFAPSLQLWQQASTSPELDAETKEILSSPEAWNWWNRIMTMPVFEVFNSRKGNSNYFDGSNYLKSGALFNRIQKLAKENRISSELIDLRDKKTVKNLVSQLQKSGQQLGESSKQFPLQKAVYS
jgi:hypothetical protein